jgi:hypothetical protein
VRPAKEVCFLHQRHQDLKKGEDAAVSTFPPWTLAAWEMSDFMARRRLGRRPRRCVMPIIAGTSARLGIVGHPPVSDMPVDGEAGSSSSGTASQPTPFGGHWNGPGCRRSAQRHASRAVCATCTPSDASTAADLSVRSQPVAGSPARAASRTSAEPMMPSPRTATFTPMLCPPAPR